MVNKLIVNDTTFESLNLKKYLPVIKNFYNQNNTSNQKDMQMFQNIMYFLNHIGKVYLSNFLTDEQVKRFVLEPKILSSLGNYYKKSKRTAIDINYVFESIKNKDLASLIGTTIHECSHYAEHLLYSKTSMETIQNDAFYNLSLKVEDSKKLFAELVGDVIVPILEKSHNIVFDPAMIKSDALKVVYYNAPFEKEARDLQEQALITLGELFAKKTDDQTTKIKILQNFFTNTKNQTGMGQIKKYDLDNSTTPILKLIKNLPAEDFVLMLDAIKKYADKFETSQYYETFDKNDFVRSKCYDYFLTYYISRMNEKQEKSFFKHLQKTNNLELLDHLDKVLLRYNNFNNNLKKLLKTKLFKDIITHEISLEEIINFGKIDLVKICAKQASLSGNLELIFEFVSRLEHGIVDCEEKNKYLSSGTFFNLVEDSLLTWKRVINFAITNRDFATAKKLVAQSKLAKSLAHFAALDKKWFDEIDTFANSIQEKIAKLTKIKYKPLKNCEFEK